MSSITEKHLHESLAQVKESVDKGRTVTKVIPLAKVWIPASAILSDEDLRNIRAYYGECVEIIRT